MASVRRFVLARRLVRPLGWAAVLATAAAGMALHPGLATLFGLLGFESSLVLAILVSLAAAHLGAGAVWIARRSAPFSDGDSAEARPLRALGARFLRAWAGAAALLVPPFAILAANALRVRNCDLPTGLAWFALLPVLSAATGSAAGVLAGALTRRRIAGTLLAIAIVLASVAWGTARFYTAPPVFGFDPFVGYFPGSLYDEELPVPNAFLAARALHALGTLAALSLAAAFLDGRRLALRPRLGSPRALAVGLLLGAVWLHARQHNAPDLAPDARTIEASLGAHRDTAHLRLIYSPTGPWAREIDLHADDFEFRFAQLAATFGVAPDARDGRIIAYLFDSAGDKRRLLGASHTQIAKPWRREIYLQHDAWPHPVVKHELAHVFAGEFGDPIFHVARHGVTINVALIEGAAVAADARPERVTPDQQVKIMRQLGIEPPLARILGPGFLAYSSSQAYTVAGSFCRFLLDRHGAERFRALYRSGGDFPSAYGRTLADLGAEWSARIDATALTDEETGQSRDRLSRPSVFRKVCAHELAIRREQARGLVARAQSDRAIALFQSVCHDDGDEPASQVELMDALTVARRDDEARALASTIAARPDAAPAFRARALQLLGDQRLRRQLADPTAPAATPDEYPRALALPLDESSARQLKARLLASAGTPFARALGRFLVGDAPGSRDPLADLLGAQRLAADFPGEGMAHYLLGRQLATRERPADAAHELLRALELGLPEGGFATEAARLAGPLSFRAGRRAEARTAFERLAADSAPSARAEAQDWLDRLAFVPPR